MFNPNEHMMKLKGKDYLQVMWRLVWFREDHPDFGINAEALELAEDHAIFKAIITNADGIQVSVGHGSESKRDFGDFIEKAETKAVGRALAMLGYGTQFAADELDEGERIVDSPVNRMKKEVDEPLPKRGDWNPLITIGEWLGDVGMGGEMFEAIYKALMGMGKIPKKARKDLTKEDWDLVVAQIEKEYPTAMRVKK